MSVAAALEAESDVSGAGHAQSFEETYRWVLPRLRQVPITRVFSTAPLDAVGLPVYSAVTPLARDLTVHGGKGQHALAARLSAIMEAIERVSAEQVPATTPTCMASFERLQREDADVMALDPSAFDLPFSTIYTPQRPISWVQGWDLIHGRPVWIARDLAISPAGEGVCAGVETNGLASGNSFTEATVHALCEVIERDAVAHAYFADALGAPEDEHRPAVRMIDVATLPSEAMGWHDRLRALGREIHVRDVTNDNGVHVFAVRLIDPFFPNGARGFVGYGAALNPVRAVMRAFTEAVQAHTTHVVGNRDEYEVGGATSDRDHRVLRNIASCWPERRWPFPRLEPQRQPADLLAELDTLVERLTIAGFRHCAVVDLTREDLQVPVVRVAVPGLAFPYGLTQRRPSPRLLAQLV